MSLLGGKNDKGSGIRCSGLCRYIADEAAKCLLSEISCRLHFSSLILLTPA